MTNLNLENIKKDFPFFDKGNSCVYLDSAATSQTPSVVLDTMDRYYKDYRANIHRGLYEAGEEASAAYERARAKVAHFIGAETNEIIFTAGATASSNMLISMLEHFLGRTALPTEAQEGRSFLESGDEVVTTVMEHHSSLIPLQKLVKRQGLILKHIPILNLALDYEEAQRLITSKTKIVSVMLASNVTGVINDVARIAEMAHNVGALVICDATTAVGHTIIDVKKLGVDFIYFSGHKICGPTGIGVLWGKSALWEALEPSVYGGGIVDEVTLEDATWRGFPERFEAGTPNIAGAIGLGSAVEYLEKIGVENIHNHIKKLVVEAIAQLEKIQGLRVIAEKDVLKNIGVVSFVSNDVHPHDIADFLGRRGIAVRAGHHCAMPLVTILGVPATTRASFYFYNTNADIDALVKGIEEAILTFTK